MLSVILSVILLTADLKNMPSKDDIYWQVHWEVTSKIKNSPGCMWDNRLQWNLFGKINSSVGYFVNSEVTEEISDAMEDSFYWTTVTPINIRLSEYEFKLRNNHSKSGC